jgi:hypothetical protein
MRVWLETRPRVQLELDMLRREWSIGLPYRQPVELGDFQRAVYVRAQWLELSGPPRTAADADASATFDKVVQQAARLHERILHRRGARAWIAKAQQCDAAREKGRQREPVRSRAA